MLNVTRISQQSMVSFHSTILYKNSFWEFCGNPLLRSRYLRADTIAEFCLVNDHAEILLNESCSIIVGCL